MTTEPRTVQATVREWSAETGGTALLDNGEVVALPASLEGSPFRLLRSGQRVRLALVDGVSTALDLP
jgi:hypothetical protein